MSMIPDLTNIKPFIGDYTQRVDTEINDAVVSNTTGGNAGGGFARFTLTNKGFLDSSSSILLGLKNNDIDGFLAPHLGVNQLIHSIVLKIGAKTISEIREFSSLQGYKGLFTSNSENLERNQYINGKIYNLAEVEDYNKAELNTKRDSKNIIFNNGLPITTTDANNFQGIRKHANTKNETIYALKLSDCLPFFSADKHFPICLIDEQINIEIHFNPYPLNVCRVLNSTEDDATTKVRATTASVINIDKVKLLADYVFYDDYLQSQYINENKGKSMQWNYIDIRLSQQMITADAQNAITKNIRNVGGANLMVNKVIMALERVYSYTLGAGATASDKANYNKLNGYAPYDTSGRLLNKFESIRTLSPHIKDSYFNFQIRYNEKPLYPIDRDNDSLLFTDIQEAEGRPFRVCKDHFSKQSEVSINKNWCNETHDFRGGTMGRLFYNVAMLDGRRINSEGIDVEFENTSIDNNTYATLTNVDSVAKNYMQYVWVETQKYAVLNNGLVDCYFK